MNAHIPVFLSTLSLRRATCFCLCHLPALGNFYPRSPCGERPAHPECLFSCCYFYPRSPCGERLQSLCGMVISLRFLSTLSLRRATAWAMPVLHTCHISIHALLAESDRVLVQLRHHAGDFYPRSPCGERPTAAGAACKGFGISIHALLAESDSAREGR